MKKRINTIDGKILVQGGTDNELKSNEIRVNADKTLTERVNGEIVNVGGSSGSGGGLRPATADDIQVALYKVSGGNSIIEDWTNELQIPSQASLDIYSKKEAPIYVNTSTLSGLNASYVSALSKTSIYNGAQDTLNITLDIYIKD